MLQQYNSFQCTLNNTVFVIRVEESKVHIYFKDDIMIEMNPLFTNLALLYFDGNYLVAYHSIKSQIYMVKLLCFYITLLLYKFNTIQETKGAYIVFFEAVV